ncbi:unnamed protein product [Gongylonema pulchrum]|uniref:Uncharacterized protein n=1 Tax=Gongylonema pulchrum TaxID=637853 RepID=A0A183EZU8_9BILA|nr:unnamed protein product [Gongylonema pulchrum]
MNHLEAPLNEDDENISNKSSARKEDENLPSNKRIMPGRKAKSLVSRYHDDLYDISSPAKKRGRREVLQQTSLQTNICSVSLNNVRSAYEFVKC